MAFPSGTFRPTLGMEIDLLDLTASTHRTLPRRSFSAQIVVVGFVLLACAAVLGIDTLRSLDERAGALNEGRAQAENLARSVAQQADDSLRAIDLVVLGLIERIGHDGVMADRLRGVMASRIAQFGAIADFAVLDERGAILVQASSGPAGDAAIDDLVRQSRDDAAQAVAGGMAHIGRPILLGPAHRWIVPLSRRFTHPDGSPGGTVIAAVDLDYFLKFHGTFDVGPNGAIALLRDDGILLTRRPFVEHSIGTDVSSSPLFTDYLPSAPSGRFESTSSIDGITRVVSYRHLAGFPLVAGAALSREDLLASWREDTWHHALIDGLLALALLLFGARLVQQIGHRERAEQAAAALAEDYRLLALNSPNMVVRVGSDGIRRYVNEELEARVAARTAELQELNQQLIERDAALRESTALIQATFDAAPFSIAVVALDFTVLSVNRTAETMMGYPAAEIIGQSILFMTPPDEREDAQESMRRVAAGEKLPGVERRRLRRDGTQVDIILSLAPVFDGDGKVRAVVVTAEDISHRKTVEAQLRQAQKMEAIGNLTGGMAHDFNNLLGIVIGNLDLLKSLRPDDADIGTLGGEALDAAIRGADLTRRLLAFARRQPLQPQHIDINALIRSVLALLSRILDANIEISLALGDELCAVTVDPAQLEASFVNLATNARDAMPKGGRLMISTAMRHLDADYAAEHAELAAGDYVMIEVSDTGTGMPASITSHIFEPFFTTKDRDRGSGLGLSMVFGFMKQSNGHINVYSEEGVGTTFRLYLPCAVAAAEAEEPAARRLPAKIGAEELVLVVEDNLALRRVAIRQLTGLGYRVLEAGTGAEAVALLETTPVDLVFTDVVLPGGMDGFALAHLVAGRFPGVKIVLTSGFPEAKLEQHLELANLRLLSKPYRKEDLARLLREALEG